MKYSRSALNPKVTVNNQAIKIAESKPDIHSLFIDSFLAFPTPDFDLLPDDPPDCSDTPHHPVTPDVAYDIVALSADFDETTAPTQEQLSRLSSDTVPFEELMLFAQTNSQIKDQHFAKMIEANSAITSDDGQRILQQLDKNDIIPEPAPAQASSSLQHLPQPLQSQYDELITQYDGLYATSKAERGHFTGFSVVAKIRSDPKVNCRQPPRHKHLPATCLKDLRLFKDNGLFEDSTGRADTHAANLTLVLKQHGKELNDKSKATKN